MRRNERRSDNLATATTGIEGRKPLFLAVKKSALYLGQLEPILIDEDAFFPGSRAMSGPLAPLRGQCRCNAE